VERGVLPDDERQGRPAVEALAGDERALAVDQRKLALVLPEREGLAFGEADVDRVGEEPLDRGGAHPRDRLELGLDLRRVDGEERRPALRADRAQHGVARGHLAALDLDVGDREAGAGGDREEAVAERAAGRAPVGPEGAAGSDCEADREKTGERGAPLPRGAGAAPPGHASHAAFSTIQETRSWNEIPAAFAMSGTSEVGVMPGWVLTSRRMTLPGSPAVSS
jgi:hypothetical protein